MTVQITDKLLYDVELYDLIEYKGEKLLDLSEYGLTPTMMHTACYRGYYANYAIIEDQLIMQRLTVKDAQGEYNQIDGVSPVPDSFGCAYVYDGLNAPMTFSGSILIAKDRIFDLYSAHNEFDLENYGRVCLLGFKGGFLFKNEDISSPRNAHDSFPNSVIGWKL